VGFADHWNTRAEDLEGPWPCDAFGTPAAHELHRAVDVAAPPAVVFRWLCQLRVAPYSYDWLDNGGRRSPATLTPGLEQLEIGQPVMQMFKLVSFERDEQITVEARGMLGLGPLQVTYRALAQPDGSRLAAKIRMERPPNWLGRVLARSLAIGDWIMMRKQLLTLKKYAETSPSNLPQAAGAPPAAG
jgi:hypothetical protein